MAKQLIDAINEVMKRANVIAGDATAFTSLVDASHQHDIDIAVQVINEGIDDLYSSTGIPQPGGQAESSITLVLNQREYTLATNLVRLRWPLIDRANINYMLEFPGGYDELLIIDAAQTFTGLPPWAAINPNTGALHTSHSPDAVSAGRVYFYEYDKDLDLVNATDLVPFTNAAFRAMVPAWTQLWKRERRNEFDADLYKMNMGRAARFMTEEEPRDSWWRGG